MICLADNDLLLHLAAWNLLAEFQALLQDRFGTAAENVYVLEGFVRRLKAENSAWERQYGRNALNRAVRFCEALPQVYSLPYDSATLIALEPVDDIDEGEAILIAVALQHPGSLILTNELRFLGALSSNPNCAPYVAALQGRILHLRQVIRELLTAKGFRALQSKIKPSQGSDLQIYRAFQGSASNAEQTLREAVEEAERMAAGMLVRFEAF